MKKSTIIFLKYTSKLLKKKFFLKNNATFLLAFSGGQDSICLLIIFFFLKKQLKLKIHILFCNHLWQKDSFFVFLHSIKISFFLKLPIAQSITNNFLGNENVSRIWRIKIFLKFQVFFHYSSLLTGHSLNDQNETFFFNFFRGSGFFGIFALQKKKFFTTIKNFSFFTKNTFIFFIKKKFLHPEQFVLGVEKKRKIKKDKILKFFFVFEKRTFLTFSILRPLLFKTRNELKNLLIKLKLPIFPDLTNQKNFLSRNRIRKQIIPTIRFFFNKQLSLTIARYRNILFQKEKENSYFIKKFYKKIFYENKNFYFINLKILKKLPFSIQKTLIVFFFKYKLKKKFYFKTFTYFFFLIKNFRINSNYKKKIQMFSEIGIFFFSFNFLIFVK